MSSLLAPVCPLPLRTCMILKWSKLFLHLHNPDTQLNNMLHKHTLISCKDWCIYKKTLTHEFVLLHSHIRCLCFTVLSLRCVGRCVRYTCWKTRFLCVRLSGSGCLTPPAPLVWRQVRGGHISAVPSDPLPSDPSYCRGNGYWKPWLLDSFSTAQPWNNPTLVFVRLILGIYLGEINIQI